MKADITVQQDSQQWIQYAFQSCAWHCNKAAYFPGDCLKHQLWWSIVSFLGGYHHIPSCVSLEMIMLPGDTGLLAVLAWAQPVFLPTQLVPSALQQVVN